MRFWRDVLVRGESGERVEQATAAVLTLTVTEPAAPAEGRGGNDK